MGSGGPFRNNEWKIADLRCCQVASPPRAPLESDGWRWCIRRAAEEISLVRSTAHLAAKSANSHLRGVLLRIDTFLFADLPRPPTNERYDYYRHRHVSFRCQAVSHVQQSVNNLIFQPTFPASIILKRGELACFSDGHAIVEGRWLVQSYWTSHFLECFLWLVGLERSSSVLRDDGFANVNVLGELWGPSRWNRKDYGVIN